MPPSGSSSSATAASSPTGRRDRSRPRSRIGSSASPSRRPRPPPSPRSKRCPASRASRSTAIGLPSATTDSDAVIQRLFEGGLGIRDLEIRGARARGRLHRPDLRRRSGGLTHRPQHHKENSDDRPRPRTPAAAGHPRLPSAGGAANAPQPPLDHADDRLSGRLLPAVHTGADRRRTTRQRRARVPDGVDGRLRRDRGHAVGGRSGRHGADKRLDAPAPGHAAARRWAT